MWTQREEQQEPENIDYGDSAMNIQLFMSVLYGGAIFYLLLEWISRDIGALGTFTTDYQAIGVTTFPSVVAGFYMVRRLWKVMNSDIREIVVLIFRHWRVSIAILSVATSLTFRIIAA